MSEESLEQLIARGLDRWWGSLGREFGPLSRPQRRALRTLADREASGSLTRVGDLATLLQFTTAGATRMLDTLEALGYAERYRARDTDQRQVYIALTVTGRAALDLADRAFTERVVASLAPLSEHDRQTLAALLTRLGGRAPSAQDAPAPADTETPPGE